MMELSERDKKGFQSLARSRNGQWLVEYLYKLDAWIADVRNGETPNDVRLGVTQVLDEHLLQQIKHHGKDYSNPSPDEFI